MIQYQQNKMGDNIKMNKELNKIKQINVLAKDIQYREGILEILEQNKDIEYIERKLKRFTDY